MSGTAIELHGVGKRYLLGARSLGGYVTLRETLAGIGRRKGPAPDELWALRDLDLEIAEGEAVGLIGHNGAGKTTLLKLLARITHPTTGVSRTRGRVGALLDVGTGFHPELNGRENIYLNGAILGMSRAEIRRRLDEIVEFSGLERFLDTPLKRYSWGMYLRLAFAVAAHVDREIMVVDEVLAVGDVRFRERCLGKMSEFRGAGRTVVFVSHDVGAIAQVCRRTVWLEHGRIRAEGPSEEVIEAYLRESIAREARVEFERRPGARVALRAVAILDDEGRPADAPRRDRPFAVAARFDVVEPVPGLDVALSIQNRAGVQVLEESWSEGGGTLEQNGAPASFEVRMTVPPILPAGDYVVGAWLGSDYETVVDERQALAFRLWPRPDDRSSSLERNRLVQPGVRWSAAAVDPDADGR